MKSVIFVTGALADGGAERVLSILASQCAEAGVDTTLVILRNKKRAYPLSEKVRVVQVAEEKKSFTTLRRIWKLHRILKESQSDTVIPFLPIITLYTMIANIGVGKKLIASERGDPTAKLFGKAFSMKDKIANLLMRRWKMICLADWIVFQTPDARAYYGDRILKKSSIIPNPLDTADLPERFTGERDRRIIAAGRLAEEKNFSMLLQAFARFHQEYPEYTLELCGEGPLRSKLEAQVERLALTDVVSMPGYVTDVQKRMQKAAMYISTSNHEGISNSMLEALGMGVPTIVTDCPVGGARMFVENEENGVLIPMEDEKSLLNAMRQIVSQPEFAEKLSRNASGIRNRLSAKIIAAQWLDLCSE